MGLLYKYFKVLLAILMLTPLLNVSASFKPYMSTLSGMVVTNRTKLCTIVI